MRLQILGIVSRGTPNQECVQFRVLMDTNLSYYLVLDTTYLSPTSISNLHRHSFWFPATPVKAGDNVFLYTGNGANRSAPNPLGGTNHFFFWGLSRTIWNNVRDCAVLMELSTWQTSTYA